MLFFDFTFKEKLVPKKNSYIILKNRSGRRFISPSSEQKDCETLLSFHASQAVICDNYNPVYCSHDRRYGIRDVITDFKNLEGEVKVEVWYSGRCDLDNALTTICDALQRSKKISSDRMIYELSIQRFKLRKEENLRWLTQVRVTLRSYLSYHNQVHPNEKISRNYKETVGYSKKDAAIDLSISDSQLDELIRSGRLKTLNIGSRVIITATSLVEQIEFQNERLKQLM